MLRTATAISAAALLALAGTSLGQQSGGSGSSGSGSSGSGAQSSGSSGQSGSSSQSGTSSQQSGQQNNQQQQQPAGGPPGSAAAPTNNLNLPQTRQPQGTTPRATQGIRGGDDELGTRSVGGTDAGAPTGVGDVGPNDPFRRNQNLNLPGVTDGRDLTPDFVRNLTPQQRLELSRQLQALDNNGGSGNVRISQQRADRLNREAQQRQMDDLRRREQMGEFGAAGQQFDEDGNFIGGDFEGSSVVNRRADAAENLRRLEALEFSLLQQNDQMLQRLGQVRQLPPQRQVGELADLMQELLLQREQTLEYIAQIRSSVSDQSLASGYGSSQRNVRSYGMQEPRGASRGGGGVEPSQYGWENERQWRELQRRNLQQQRARQERTEFGDPERGRWYDEMDDRR